jgi:2-polyprenyl-6-methoxyphenol hydroxylase-like FAD-dependent oxidoreductase
MITIVGAGHVGAILAYRFLAAGHVVRIIDSGSKLIRQHQQIPWGWCRGFSLQQDVRVGAIDIPFTTPKIYGPMLISTNDSNRINNWKQWLFRNKHSDAVILDPDQAYATYAIVNKHVFVCDSRDFIINYKALNAEIWDYLKSHKNCEFIENQQIKAVGINNHMADCVITSDNTVIPVNSLIIASGNQNRTIKSCIECGVTISRFPFNHT